MIKLNNRQINSALYKRKLFHKVRIGFKGLMEVNDYICDAVEYRKQNVYTNGDENGRKGKGIMATNGSKEIVVADEFDKLTPKERVFFWLYNSDNYYDEKFGGKTYLDEILCYLIAYCRNVAEKYGSFKKKENNKEMSEEEKINALLDSNVEDYNKMYKNFTFKSVKEFTYIKTQASRVLRNKNIINCTKELVKATLEDTDYTRARYIKEVETIAKGSESDKTRLEAYKLLGNWVGIDKPVVQNNINVVMNAIDNDLQRQGFDFDISGFTIDDNK